MWAALRAIDSHRKKQKRRTRKSTETFHATNHDITTVRKMSSPFIQEVRTKESILSSLSRNDPIQPLDFTLRSRYETISISFAKGPSGTEDFFDISRGFGILYGPLYLTPLALFLPPPALFLSFFLLLFHASPDAYRSNRVAVELVRLLLDNTDIRV